MRGLPALLLLGLAGAAAAAVPQRLNYQGKLADASGNPLTGTYSFRFKLFAAETGGAALFSEDVTGANAVPVVNGIYTVQFGSYTAGGVPYGVFDGSDLYLEIDVNPGSTLAGAETLSPRERLSAAAWAVHSLGAERLGTGAVVSTHTAAGDLLVARNVSASSGMFTGGYFSVGGSTLVATGGRVGIGTSGPGHILQLGSHFNGSVAGGALFINAGGYNAWNGKVAISPDGNAAVASVVSGYHDSALNIQKLALGTIGYSGVEQTLVLQDGKAGVGSLDPAARLHVSSGTLLIDGNAATSITTTGDVALGAAAPAARLDVAGAYYSRLVNGGNSGAALTVDWSAGNVQFVTLTANATLSFSNGRSGGRYVLALKQDATGGRSVTWPAAARWSGGAAPALTATANKTDYVGFIYNGVDGVYDGVAFSPNF